MSRETRVWLMMVGAVALHVIDETLTDFLPYYNAQVVTARSRFGFFPAPTFTFSQWIGGLTTAVLVGFAATPFVVRGGRAIRIVCGVLSGLMIANACGHIFGSMYLGYFVPGFWSSPLLAVTSIWMLRRVWVGNWSRSVAAPARRRPSSVRSGRRSD